VSAATLTSIELQRIAAAIEAGELVLRSTTPFERRDAIIRETYHQFFLGNLRALADRMRMYERTAWPRERAFNDCPAHRVGKPEERFWQALRLVPRSLSHDRIRKIVG
jgi:hypothetical protein